MSRFVSFSPEFSDFLQSLASSKPRFWGSRGSRWWSGMNLSSLNSRSCFLVASLCFTFYKLFRPHLTFHRSCQKFAFVDRQDHDAMDILICPFNCGYLWCKACQQQVHHGAKHSCDGTEEMARLMKVKGWRACPGTHSLPHVRKDIRALTESPGCKTPTEKIHGCHHMTVSQMSHNDGYFTKQSRAVSSTSLQHVSEINSLVLLV